MLDKLKELNLKLINEYQSDENKLQIQLIIQKLLENKRCFFEMDIETAYSILKDLTIPEENIKEIYKSLVDIRNYE